MGYSTIILVERILAQALTSSSPRDLATPVDLLKIGNTLDTNLVSESIADQYILWADEDINAAINELYRTPLCEKADFETVLFSDINEYNPYIITEKGCPWYPGDTIILNDGIHEEMHIIKEVIDLINRNIFLTEQPVNYNFKASDTRVIRIKYPEPVTLVSARLAAANIYDKYLMSQSSPNKSEYGQYLRQMARVDINNILNGRTILHGQQRIGRRFYNANLVDRYSLPGDWGEHNMEDIS